ncbi:hypothetical protein [Thermogutta sp.]|uniref:hypothetical protein n=1 Tax=Thermogutta sp. TaxID=1962930 RepID=UPI00322014D9
MARVDYHKSDTSLAMSDDATGNRAPLTNVLTSLMRRLGRSLAVYAMQARPWIPYRREELWELLEEIASQHREWAEQLAEEITAGGRMIELGPFPSTYTRFHDVSVDFLAIRILDDLRDIRSLAEQAGQLPGIGSELAALLTRISSGLSDQASSLEKALIQAKILAAQASDSSGL